MRNSGSWPALYGSNPEVGGRDAPVPPHIHVKPFRPGTLGRRLGLDKVIRVGPITQLVSFQQETAERACFSPLPWTMSVCTEEEPFAFQEEAPTRTWLCWSLDLGLQPPELCEYASLFLNRLLCGICYGSRSTLTQHVHPCHWELFKMSDGPQGWQMWDKGSPGL